MKTIDEDTIMYFSILYSISIVFYFCVSYLYITDLNQNKILYFKHIIWGTKIGKHNHINMLHGYFMH